MNTNFLEVGVSHSNTDKQSDCEESSDKKRKRERNLSKERSESKDGRKKTKKMGTEGEKLRSVDLIEEGHNEDDYVKIDPEAMKVAFDEDNKETTEMEVIGEASDQEEEAYEEDSENETEFEDMDNEGKISFRRSSRYRSRSETRGRRKVKRKKDGKEKTEKRRIQSQSDDSESRSPKRKNMKAKISGEEKEEIVDETVGRMKSLLEGMFGKRKEERNKYGKRSRDSSTSSRSRLRSFSRSQSRSLRREMQRRRSRDDSSEERERRRRRGRSRGRKCSYSNGKEEIFESPSETTIYRTAIRPKRQSDTSSDGLNLLNSSDETNKTISSEKPMNLDGKNEQERDTVIDKFLSTERRRVDTGYNKERRETKRKRSTKPDRTSRDSTDHNDKQRSDQMVREAERSKAKIYEVSGKSDETFNVINKALLHSLIIDE